MTVRELIKKLKLAPQDAKIVTEGCDCDGDCAFVVLDEKGGVLLARSDAYYSRHPRGKQL